MEEKKNPTVLAKQQRTDKSVETNVALSSYRPTFKQPTLFSDAGCSALQKKRKDAHNLLLYGHISDQHAPPGIVPAPSPHTCLNGICACIVCSSLSRKESTLISALHS